MSKKILNRFLDKYNSNQKSLIVLIDPDEYNNERNLNKLISLANSCAIDFFFVGGSLLRNPDISKIVESIKEQTNIPIVLFPGNGLYLSEQADAVLFLSLISGRNPELLIGQHVIVAKSLKESGIEVIPTGYILVDGGKPTSVSYLSFTLPIPADKPEIASSTALAGELLGMKMIYLEAGSGAINPVSESVINAVQNAIDVPLLVGGGISSAEKALKALHAGADAIVVGNKIEENSEFLKEVSDILVEFNRSLDIH